MIEKITYNYGMVSKLRRSVARASSLTCIEWTAPDMPSSVLASLEDENVLELPDEMGDPMAGTPIEIDLIEVRADGVRKSIQVCNRGIGMLQIGRGEMKRVHRFCCAMWYAAKEEEE